MRLLVISDSHRKGNIVEDIIQKEPTARHIFFLGDNTSDIEDFQYLYRDREFHICSGNCDFVKEFPLYDIISIAGHNIFYTHGHEFSVKSSTGVLLQKAKNLGCDIVLYGHTHISLIQYEDGVYVVNPGSCAQSRSGPCSYAVIDIENGGIMPIIKSL